MKTSSSLRVRLLAPFILGTLILALLLSWYTYTSSRKSMENAALLISEAKTNYTTDTLEVFFKSLSVYLQNIVAYPQITAVFKSSEALDSNLYKMLAEQNRYSFKENRDPEVNVIQTVTWWLEDTVRSSPFLRDILILNKEGVCIVSSNESYIGNSYMDKSYVQQALAGWFNFSEFSVGRITKQVSAYGAGPIDLNEHIVGALVIIKDSQELVDYEKKYNHDSQVITVSLLTPDGMFAVNIDNDLMGNPNKRYPDLYNQLATVGTAGDGVSYELDGEKYIGYARLEPNTKWLVITSGKESEVFASSYRMGMVVLAISLVSLAVIYFMVIRMANGILSTLLSLIGYAKRVSEGDWSQDLQTTTRNDELGILHAALHRLVESLREMLQKTKAADKLKGDFLANMSHEMRTPLNAIISMSHLSQREGNLPKKQEEYVTRIQIAAKSLLGVINDILDVSKVEAGKLVMEHSPFNLRETISDAIAIHQENAKLKGLELNFEYSADAPTCFVGDSLRVGQILNNLLSNAIKFTEQGSVTVRCWQDCDHSTSVRANMCVSVIDTGVGIAEDALSSLFQPFIQADASIARNFGGTGLGLAISNSLVKLMGGEFSLESKENEGSKFTFFMNLPIAEGKCVSEIKPVSLSAAFESLNIEGRRILLVEDNEINQLIVEEFLEPSKVHIIAVDNGKKAVQAVENSSFDLVLMDMQMPIMDGLEATRHIRELPQGKNLPIIAVTASARDEDRKNAIDSGMDDFLTKPIDPGQLIAILRKWLGG